MSHLIHAREAEARAVLRIRAVEETDSEGRVLPELERRRAGEAARTEYGESAPSSKAAWRYLVSRARALEVFLKEGGGEVPHLPGDQIRAWLPLPVLGGALALGFTGGLLGPERHIQLLSLPLFGILAWNLGMYSFRLLALLRGSGLRRPSIAPPKGLPWIRRQVGRGSRARFAHLWSDVAAPLELARLRSLLHLAALTVAGGTVAGMYLRGLVFAYRATWESTFLEAPQVERSLGWVLGPAAWVSGIEIPSVAGLEAPNSGPAADWIHLFAVTLLLVVGLPRLLLFGRQTARVLRLKRLPVDLSAAYYRRRLAEARGEAEVIRLIPYSFQPSPAVEDALRSLLVESLGSRTEVRGGPPLEYGSSPEEESARPLLVFSLRHTPEAEVHGELLREVANRVPSEEQWVVVDEGGFGGDGERREDRRRLWRRLGRQAGFEVLTADLAAESAALLYDRLAEVMESCRASN